MLVKSVVTYLSSVRGKSSEGRTWQIVDLLPEGDRPISISTLPELDFGNVCQGDEITVDLELRNSAKNNAFYARVLSFKKGG